MRIRKFNHSGPSCHQWPKSYSYKHWVSSLINGHEYITVGSAGTAFVYDGPGNVDHMMWMTIKDDGPEYGNITLKGIFDRMGLDTGMFGAYDRAPGSAGMGH